MRAAQKVYAKFIEEMKEKTKEMKNNPPKKTPGGKTIPSDTSKGLTKEEIQLQSRKSTRATNTTLMIQRHTNTEVGHQRRARGYKLFQANTRRNSTKCTARFQKKEVHRQDCEGNENQETDIAESLRQRFGRLESWTQTSAQQHQRACRARLLLRHTWEHRRRQER